MFILKIYHLINPTLEISKGKSNHFRINMNKAESEELNAEVDNEAIND